MGIWTTGRSFVAMFASPNDESSLIDEGRISRSRAREAGAWKTALRVDDEVEHILGGSVAAACVSCKLVGPRLGAHVRAFGEIFVKALAVQRAERLDHPEAVHLVGPLDDLLGGHLGGVGAFRAVRGDVAAGLAGVFHEADIHDSAVAGRALPRVREGGLGAVAAIDEAVQMGVPLGSRVVPDDFECVGPAVEVVPPELRAAKLLEGGGEGPQLIAERLVAVGQRQREEARRVHAAYRFLELVRECAGTQACAARAEAGAATLLA